MSVAACSFETLEDLASTKLGIMVRKPNCGAGAFMQYRNLSEQESILIFVMKK